MRAYGWAIAFIGAALATLLFGIWQDLYFTRRYGSAAVPSVETTDGRGTSR